MGDIEKPNVGALIAHGRSADVYATGPGRVLRRRTDGGSSEWEAGVMRWAASHGVPVPEVLSAEGPDLVMAAIDGPTFLETLAADPGSAGQVGRVLADLHRRLDDVPAPPGLVRRDPGSDQPVRLLHGDLHPGNVIDSPDGPVLIDWTNAAAGRRSLDVAESWLLISAYDPGLGPAWLVARTELAVALLDGADGPDPAALREVAARRLDDPNTAAAERDAIRTLTAALG
jgi:aminoglycoside phosphotransferase (APT) family kinase protein